MAATSFLPIDIHGRYKAIFFVGTPVSSIYLNKEKNSIHTFLYSYYFETNKSETKLNDLPLSTSFFKSE